VGAALEEFGDGGRFFAALSFFSAPFFRPKARRWPKAREAASKNLNYRKWGQKRGGAKKLTQNGESVRRLVITPAPN
jgi:hypothetical protein